MKSLDNIFVHELLLLDPGYRRRLAQRKRAAVEQAADRARRAVDATSALNPDTARWFRRRYPKRVRTIEQAIEARSLKAKADFHRRKMN
jgi:hypothetical protein